MQGAGRSGCCCFWFFIRCRMAVWASAAESILSSRAIRFSGACRLEDGTLAFLDIIALRHGFEFLSSLGGMSRIQQHTMALADWLYSQLSALRHRNGAPVVKARLPEAAGPTTMGAGYLQSEPAAPPSNAAAPLHPFTLLAAGSAAALLDSVSYE